MADALNDKKTKTVKPEATPVVETPVTSAPLSMTDGTGEPSPVPEAAPAPVFVPVAEEAEAPVSGAAVSAKAAIMKPKTAPEAAEPVVKVKKTVSATSVPKPAKPKLTPPKSTSAAPAPTMKGINIMTAIPTTPKAAAEQVQALFGDMSTRAKAALEKSTKVGEELTAFTKGNVEAFAASAKTAAKGAEAIGQEVVDFGKKSFETASATAKSMTAAKSPTELFQMQSDFAKASFDSAVTEASKLSEAWLKLAGDIFQPLSTRYAVAAEKIKSASL